MRVGIYCRLSRLTDTNVANIDDQVKRCREYATQRGWAIVAELVDRGESAFDREHIDDRPGFGELLGMVRRRELEAVLAWRPDRLWRDPIEAAVFLRACKTHGVTTVSTVIEGDRDPDNAGDEMVTTIVAAVSRYESAAKSARLRAKARQLAEAGRPAGGHTPFGFVDAKRSEVDPTEAATLNEAVDRVLAGASIRSICADFNARGITTKRGAAWAPANLRRLITEWHIAGVRIHHDTPVGPATWPALVPIDKLLAVREMLADPARRKNDGARPYLLTAGLARCGLCGATLVARPREDKRRAYTCATGPGFHGCGHMGVLADPFEADVLERMWTALEGARPPASAEPPDPSTRLKVINAKLADLSRLHFVDDVIGRGEYLAARAPLAAEAATLRLPRPQRAAVSDLGDLRARWDELDHLAQRRAVGAIIDHVVLSSGVRGLNRYDPRRVSIVWKA